MEKQTFINVGVGGFTTGYSINSGVSMESVEMTNCMIQAAGINGATCLYLNGNLKGWKASLTVERLTGTNVLISNTDAACTNNNLADLRIHTLGTFAAAPNIKDAGISQPTIYKDGPDYKMAAALGGYVDRVFRDTDTQPRFRRSYSTFEWGPGGASGIDSNFGRLGSASVGSTTSKVTGYGLDASDQPITNVAPGVNADDAATVSQLGSGGGGTSGSVGVALHGSNASFTRPTGYGSIEWIGTVEPANAEDGDTFVDTNATGLFNVNNYGADPTGVADSTSAISDAIDALAASDSTTGVLYFPAGTYLLTPASPALELAAGTTVLGDGRSNTFLKVKNSPTSVSRIFDIAGGRVEFRNICFSGSTTPGAVTRNVIGIRHNNVAGIYTYMQNVGSLRMNNLLTSYDGVSQTVEAVDCYFDGGGIGSISGEAQENSTGLNCPHVGGGVIARNTTFTGWGSDTAAGSNFDHAIYLREETPLSIDGCQFLAQYDGRYIQVNGTAAAPGAGVAPAFWGVRNSYFGTPTTGNDMLHTSPLRRGIISDCEFAASTNYGNHVPAAIVPKGDVLISNCLFRGGASTHYTINALTASVKLSIKDCVFAGTSAIDILLNANSISLNVANCEFFSSATTSHVFQNTAKTFGYVIASDNNFQMASGCAAISSSTSGSFFAILAANNQFTTGAYGVRVQSGASCLVLQLRGNFFSGQTTTAVSKAGTVTTELSSNNFGYGVDGSYSVLNYGADPTGVADAQTQIQATLDACDTAGGGEVFIPKGTYILASGIKIGSNTTVRGQGNQSILKLKGGLSGGFPTSYVVTHKAYANATGTNSNIILRDFMIDGNKANCSADPLVGGAGNYPNAVLIFGVTGAGTRPSDIRVQNLCIKEAPLFSMALYRIDRLVCSNNVIYNGNRDGINADYSIDVTITGNVVDRVGDDHIVVGGTSKNVTISGNSVSEDSTTLARGKGIVVRGGTDVAITGNTVDSTCDAGIVVRDDFGDASRISIVGNKISDTGTGGGVTTYDGILLNATAGNTVKDISIVGNQINDALHNGIYVLNGGALGDLERIDIRSNQINNPATAGIKVDDNARNVTIDSNKIFSAGTVGILSTATNNEDLTVIDNHVNTSASHGIQLASFTDGYIANNYSHDNVGTGLILTPDTSVGVAWKDNFCQGNGTEYNIVGVTVASTAALAAPTQEVVTVSGTAAITSITGGFAGQRLFLVFSGTAAAAGLTDGSNLKLAGDFAYTPDDGISLVCDGTNWYETGRSVN
jgi:polygalacturonase